ncbi:hypothetical protein AWZ03_011376 [Drosophila navojoa]|uniref:Uncharacterized protein n=1 Tax=Drosophila navojoa TaxID=7232 RepID=A0A484B301_DRONA|nr:hypothetical protein AWZ03_011376 [Drosophila navojoa]
MTKVFFPATKIDTKNIHNFLASSHKAILYREDHRKLCSCQGRIPSGLNGLNYCSVLGDLNHDPDPQSSIQLIFDIFFICKFYFEN